MVKALNVHEMDKAIRLRMEAPNAPDCSSWGYAKSIYNYTTEKLIKEGPLDNKNMYSQSRRIAQTAQGLGTASRGGPLLIATRVAIAQQIIETARDGYDEHRRNCMHYEAGIESLKQMESEPLATVTYSDEACSDATPM